MGSYKKKLFIVLLLILLIGFFVCGSVNATTVYQNSDMYSVNPVEVLENEQEYLAKIFISKMITRNSYINNKEEVDNLFKNNYVYFYYYKPTGTNVIRIIAHFYASNVDFATLDSDLIDTEIYPFYDANLLIPVSGYNLTYTTAKVNKSITLNVNNGDIAINNNNNSFFLPTFLIFYNNNTISNFNNDVLPNENFYLMIMESIQDNTEQEEETTNELKKLNDFMKSDDVDSDSYDMPGNNDNPTQDITQNGVNNIFDIFYNEINNWESQNITVRIPFTNKFFYIPANLTENIIDTNFPAGAFKNLLGLIWYYLLAVYIIKDVQKYIDGLQTGEILTKSDTNIKTEML